MIPGSGDFKHFHTATTVTAAMAPMPF